MHCSRLLFLEAFGEKIDNHHPIYEQSDLTGGLSRNNIHLLVSAPGQVPSSIGKLEFVSNLVDGGTFAELPYIRGLPGPFDAMSSNPSTSMQPGACFVYVELSTNKTDWDNDERLD